MRLGNPVNDAEINVPLAGKSTHTDRNGEFALVGMVPNVSHEVWFRRIGFESARFVWRGEEGKRVSIAVTLQRLPNTLDPTVVWANETNPFVDVDGRGNCRRFSSSAGRRRRHRSPNSTIWCRENGVQAQQWPLGPSSADEIERSEYYPAAPPEREYTHTIEPRMQAEYWRGMDGTHPAWYVLWLKGAK